jgi:dTDP-4-dehydrorhamnose reductase
MKILITGANGLVGQKLKTELSRREGIQLIATSQSPEMNALDTGYVFETLDITDKSAIDYILSRYRPDAVINTAAIANVNGCEKNKSTCWQVNTEAVKFLTEATNRSNTHLIHFSTDFVFEGTQSVYHEHDIPNPVNFYGTSKKEAEDHIMQHAKKWSIIRTILVYGYVPHMKRKNIILWIYDSLKNGKSIKVVNDQFRTPTLGEDLAWACAEIAINNKTGIWHISGKETMSIDTLAFRTADHFSLDRNLIIPVPSVVLNEPAPRPPRTAFNLLNAEKELYYSPRSFEEGLNIIEKQLYNNQ